MRDSERAAIAFAIIGVLAVLVSWVIAMFLGWAGRKLMERLKRIKEGAS